MAENTFLEKFEKVGVGWKKEKSIGIAINADLYENDKVLMIENRDKLTEKHPDFNLFRERKVKIVTEE